MDRTKETSFVRSVPLLGDGNPAELGLQKAPSVHRLAIVECELVIAIALEIPCFAVLVSTVEIALHPAKRALDIVVAVWVSFGIPAFVWYSVGCEGES